MNRPRVFIDGEAGTTGLQIGEQLRLRDDIQLLGLPKETRKDPEARRALMNEADLAILCLPDDAARESVALIMNPAVRVIDASTAHRVHSDWVYGFPELTPGQAEKIKTGRFVANPGCYATGAIALLRPLVDAGVIPREQRIAIHGVSGYSGGGRKLIEAFEGEGPDRTSDRYRLYALELSHKHLDEMREYSGLAERPLFWPAVGAFRQGMLVQIPLHLDLLPSSVAGTEIYRVLQDHYRDQPLIHVGSPDAAPPAALAPEALNDSNSMELFVFENRKLRHILLVARLDNLGKGASRAAVQNMDLMLGLNGN